MPKAGAGAGLFVLPELRVWRVPGYAAGALFSGRRPGAELIGSLTSATISTERVFAVHVDGERLPRPGRVELECVESVLPVVA